MERKEGVGVEERKREKNKKKGISGKKKEKKVRITRQKTEEN